MWLRQGLYVTSDSKIQQSDPLWHQRQGDVHPTEAESGVWSSDGTDGGMAGLRTIEARELEARDPGIGGRLGKQDMEKDGNEREWRIDIECK